jgi:hypothetical protein
MSHGHVVRAARAARSSRDARVSTASPGQRRAVTACVWVGVLSNRGATRRREPHGSGAARASRGARSRRQRRDRAPWAVPRRARRAGIHGAGRAALLSYTEGARGAPSFRLFFLFLHTNSRPRSARRVGPAGLAQRPCTKARRRLASSFRALEARRPATASRGATGTGRRPGGPLSRRESEKPVAARGA